MADDQEVAERQSTLEALEEWLETPMLVLSAVWLGLVAVEFVWGAGGLLEVIGTGIWIVFILEFALRLNLAPDRRAFLLRNWLAAIALIAPALRLLRVFFALRLLHAVRMVRGLRLVRLVGTANRSMNALRSAMSRRGFGYVAALTAIVALLGAAGIFAFEPAHEVEGGFESYWHALWWTAMVLTTMGSDFWPRTPEGRVLCLLLAIYAFTVWGYITASIASFFVGRDSAAVQDAARQGRPPPPDLSPDPPGAVPGQGADPQKG